MFRWTLGRQENFGKAYYKMCLANFKKFDMWLIRYPETTGLVTHTDPVPKGYEHHRFNIVLKNPEHGGEFVCPQAFINTPRIKYFRPDIHPHSVKAASSERLVLSFGWLRKA